VGYVWDYSQTIGPPGTELPSMVKLLDGEAENGEALLKALEATSSAAISYEDYGDRSNGYFDPKNNRIVVKASLPALQRIKTLAHERVHEVLHSEGGIEEAANRHEREIEAESVSFIILNYFGIDSSDYTFGYVQSWASGRDLPELQTKLEIIRKTAAEKGYSEGSEKSRSTAEKYLSAAAELVSQATAQKEAYYISHKDELIETACFLAEKLIATKLSEDKSVIANIAANAAKDFRNSERVKISLASADISAEATADIDYLKSLIKGIPDIEIEILENAKTGTVVLDNGSEIIDASVPTQLDFLKEIMENSRIRKTED
jgi:flagellar biosynthesis/type III secretory pathway protein FliH